MGTLTRIARTAAATLTHTFYVGEDPAVATDVTVVGTGPDNTAVFSGTATPDGQGWSYAMPAQAQLTVLDVTWSGTVGGTVVIEHDQVEIVGGFLFTLAQGRASDASLADRTKYPTSALERARTEVEQECEWICAQAWVPRYRRVTLDGTGTPDVVLPDAGQEMRGGIVLQGVRAIRSAAVAPAYGQTPVPVLGAQLAALSVRPGGVLRRTDRAVWTAGEGNVVLEYEYGNDTAPADLVRAALTRFRSRLQLGTTQIPDRAVSFTVAEMGTYRLALPDAYRTGIPEVDAAYGRYSRRVSDSGGTQAAPASRTLDYDPQFFSLHHGGRR
jgi:hypothetical protein